MATANASAFGKSLIKSVQVATVSLTTSANVAIAAVDRNKTLVTVTAIGLSVSTENAIYVDLNTSTNVYLEFTGTNSGFSRTVTFEIVEYY